MKTETKQADVYTTAKVRVTVEVDAGPWGQDCTAQQVFDQASREAPQKVMNTLSKLGSGVRLVGKPKVTMVLVRENDL